MAKLLYNHKEEAQYHLSNFFFSSSLVLHSGIFYNSVLQLNTNRVLFVIAVIFSLLQFLYKAKILKIFSKLYFSLTH